MTAAMSPLILNETDKDGTPICPRCEKLIAIRDAVIVMSAKDRRMAHVNCLAGHAHTHADADAAR